jgi:tryptophanyl-tRNA synthetase
MSENKRKPRVMSGMRSTGSLHIGHYFGALKNWFQLQDDYDCYFGAMDWHGMTTLYKDTKKVDGFSREIIAEWIAWGLDPEKSTVFIQSRVPEHLELMMIFANLTPMGWLERVTTWKDGIEEMKQNDTHNLGRFAYPVLQAADISVYLGEFVPVGQDQVAHLELTREIVRRFNRLYKAKVPEPKPLLTETPFIIGTDGRKMSKSYGNVFPLVDEPKAIEKRVKKMVTDTKRVRREDPGDPKDCPVYEYHKLFSSEEDRQWVVDGCTTAGIGCGDCKMRLASNINSLMEKPREIKKELLNHPDRLDSIINEGCQKARTEAQKTMTLVRKAMGLNSGIS